MFVSLFPFVCVSFQKRTPIHACIPTTFISCLHSDFYFFVLKISAEFFGSRKFCIRINVESVLRSTTHYFNVNVTGSALNVFILRLVYFNGCTGRPVLVVKMKLKVFTALLAFHCTQLFKRVSFWYINTLPINA